MKPALKDVLGFGGSTMNTKTAREEYRLGTICIFWCSCFIYWLVLNVLSFLSQHFHRMSASVGEPTCDVNWMSRGMCVCLKAIHFLNKIIFIFSGIFLSRNRNKLADK